MNCLRNLLINPSRKLTESTWLYLVDEHLERNSPKVETLSHSVLSLNERGAEWLRSQTPAVVR